MKLCFCNIVFYVYTNSKQNMLYIAVAFLHLLNEQTKWQYNICKYSCMYVQLYICMCVCIVYVSERLSLTAGCQLR